MVYTHPFSFNVTTNILPFITYEFQVSACSAIGCGLFTDVSTVTTDEDGRLYNVSSRHQRCWFFSPGICSSWCSSQHHRDCLSYFHLHPHLLGPSSCRDTKWHSYRLPCLLHRQPRAVNGHVGTCVYSQHHNHTEWSEHIHWLHSLCGSYNYGWSWASRLSCSENTEWQ